MRRTLPVLSLSLLLSACSNGGGGNDTGTEPVTESVTGPVNETETPTEAPVAAGLATAEAAWEAAAINDYQFILTRICYCDPRPPVVVIVKDDAVESAFYQHNGVYLTAADIETDGVTTIDGLFTEIKDAYAAEVAGVDAIYDKARGYPVDVLINYSEEFVDEEDGFLVTGFQ